jgi:hypothetical protein
MANMNTELLVQAARVLANLFPGKDVTGIEFEDGSGHKFNYHLSGGKWQYVDLGKAFLKSKPEFDAGDHLLVNKSY